ncbi:PREDICTED: agamous-like MADS-box protein AGL27 isoform X2 [Camelina sativa]|uniref:Agamous-like MADS-box protein AGL27 isoform X2 n=1 Tax=Camelina sativa TaxID=90675 RepID=A0ABM1R8N5_CAMSA|nr:PREDICTED: agamous-like MADS-box protein AGL27 isoform X2 [Camelina sativa]
MRLLVFSFVIVLRKLLFLMHFCFVHDISSMSKIIDRYEIQHADEQKVLDLEEKARNYLPHKELLEIVQRKLEEPVDNVSVDSLMSMEEQLETALSVTRAKKTELMMEDLKSLQEKEKLLREENQFLASQMGQKTFLVTEGERGMSPENSSGNKIPETLPLLK